MRFSSKCHFKTAGKCCHYLSSPLSSSCSSPFSWSTSPPSSCHCHCWKQIHSPVGFQHSIAIFFFLYVWLQAHVQAQTRERACISLFTFLAKLSVMRISQYTNLISKKHIEVCSVHASLTFVRPPLPRFGHFTVISSNEPPEADYDLILIEE